MGGCLWGCVWSRVVVGVVWGGGSLGWCWALQPVSEPCFFLRVVAKTAKTLTAAVAPFFLNHWSCQSA